MALHSLYCADVPLRNCSHSHTLWTDSGMIRKLNLIGKLALKVV